MQLIRDGWGQENAAFRQLMTSMLWPSRIQCPTWLLHSRHDARVPLSEAQAIADRVPGARLHVFDSPNHAPMRGEPAFKEVNRAILDFVDGTMR